MPEITPGTISHEFGQSATGQDLVLDALALIGKYSVGESLNGDLGKQAFRALNRMVDQWRTQRLMIANLTDVSHPLVSGKKAYTVGPGGEIDMPRPYAIKYAAIINASNPTYRRHIYVNDKDDLSIEPYSELNQTHVGRIYYEPSFPLGTIHVPESGSTDTLVMAFLSAFPGFATPTTEYVFMPGYASALHYNLAVQMAPYYGVQLAREIIDQAHSTIADVKRINTRHAILGNFFGQRGSYNIYSDEYR